MTTMEENDNRYAWRLNCEDGSEYGVSPEDYETRDEYNEALRAEKYAWRDSCEVRESSDDESEEEVAETIDLDPSDAGMGGDQENASETSVSHSYTVDPFADDDFHVYTYCRVRLSETGTVIYYRTEDNTLRKGDKVLVPSPIGEDWVIGEILAVERHMRFSVPTPIGETKIISGRI